MTIGSFLIHNCENNSLYLSGYEFWYVLFIVLKNRKYGK